MHQAKSVPQQPHHRLY